MENSRTRRSDVHANSSDGTAPAASTASRANENRSVRTSIKVNWQTVETATQITVYHPTTPPTALLQGIEICGSENSRTATLIKDAEAH
jgi:hypothetical protein